jgi:putative phosphoesterase
VPEKTFFKNDIVVPKPMRIAVVSDIHGNLTAFEAVLADLQHTRPDLTLHGGDLADSGSSPREIVDRIRALGWPGVLGNTDQKLISPAAFAEFASQNPKLSGLFAVIAEMAVFTREALGPERLAWLSSQPTHQLLESLALVHASPDDLWRAPAPESDDSKLEFVYGRLDRPLVVYGHIHRPFIRKLPRFTLANSGSVSLSYDGDPRASYLLVTDGQPEIRRVSYDLDLETNRLSMSGLPYAGWVAAMMRAAAFHMPPGVATTR